MFINPALPLTRWGFLIQLNYENKNKHHGQNQNCNPEMVRLRLCS